MSRSVASEAEVGIRILAEEVFCQPSGCNLHLLGLRLHSLLELSLVQTSAEKEGRTQSHFSI